jgi:hypothetical protein
MRANEMQAGRHEGTGKYSRAGMQAEGYANIHRLTLRQRNTCIQTNVLGKEYVEKAGISDRNIRSHSGRQQAGRTGT